MSKLLIAIGGSGSRIATACIHAIAANLLDDDGKLEIMSIDKDVKNGTTDSFIVTKKVYQNFTELMGSDTKTRRLAKYDVADNPWTLQALLKGRDNDALERYYPNQELLLKTVFSNEELTKPLKDGFERHPNIGAVFFERIKLEPTFSSAIDQALRDANGGDAAQFFIVGSIFGGTGASMASNIAQFIHEKAQGKYTRDGKPGNNVRGNVTIGGALMLPYFEIPQPVTEKDRTGYIITDNDFIEASQKSLQYYNDIEGLLRNKSNKGNAIFDALYLMGYSPRCKIKRGKKPEDEPRYAKGGENQTSDCGIVDYFAASAFIHFLNQREKLDSFEATGTDQNLFIAQLASTQENAAELNSIGWDNLPPGSKKMLTMTRFSLFITTYFYAGYIATKNKEKTLYCSMLSVNARKSADKDLKTAYAYCRSFLEFMLDIASTRCSSGDFCSLLDTDTFAYLLERLDGINAENCTIAQATKLRNEIDAKVAELGAQKKGMTADSSANPSETYEYNALALVEQLQAKYFSTLFDKSHLANNTAELLNALYDFCAETKGGNEK